MEELFGSGAGALLQLVAYNTQNIKMNLRNVSYYYTTYYPKVNDDKITIFRFSDMTTPEYLELSLKREQEDPLEYVKQLVLTMKINEVVIEQIPLCLLVQLHEPVILPKGPMYIQLCFDMLFGEIKMVPLLNQTVTFHLNHMDGLSSYGITVKQCYVDNSERRTLLAGTMFEQPIQQLSWITVKADAEDESVSSEVYEIAYLPFENLSKGFFIECKDVDALHMIHIKFNNMDRLQLNRFLIQTKCKKINSQLLYLPFNETQSFSDRDASSYVGAANLSRLDAVFIKMVFDTPMHQIKIYNISANVCRQLLNTCELLYPIDLTNGTYDLRNPPAMRTLPESPTAETKENTED